MSEKRTYIEVAVAGAAGAQEVFTYHADQPVPVGGLVTVPFGNRTKVGLITQTVAKPSFNTRAVDKVLPIPPLPQPLIKLARWISDYYATPLTKTLQSVLPPQLAASPRSLATARPASQSPLGMSLVKLTDQQTRALTDIETADKPVLLHGATGSGKTQVYIELAKAVITRGHSALVLVPEIALTTQMTDQFKAVFGERVLLTHSGLTAAARRNIWLRVLANPEPLVVIGPRSALFMPFERLGLIVVDESHETSYKQDQAPRYHAVNVAAELARSHQAKLVLGSATPSVTEMYLAERGLLKLITMPAKVHRATASPPQVIDLKDPAQLSRQSRLISRPLLATLRDTLVAGKQSILLMNRRGSARLTVCAHCGWVANCPKCQIPFTFHADAGQLLCHWCGTRSQPPVRCEECGQANIQHVGAGTKRLEQELAKLMPEARLVRLDSDSPAIKNLRQTFDKLRRGQVDILLGTQMVAKGLDLPRVETVGVVLADQLFYLPDFTAAERAFQLLHQVAGRGGRAHGATSQTIIQTYSPDHPVITTVVSGNYEQFRSRELKDRQTFGYPPFVYLLKLTAAYKTRTGAERSTGRVAADLRSTRYDIQVLGPAPAFRETLGGKYHWQIIVKSKQRAPLVEIARSVPANWAADLDPVDLL